MKILVISPYLPLSSSGGGGTRCEAIVSILSRQHQIDLIALYERKPANKEIENLNGYFNNIKLEKINIFEALINGIENILVFKSLKLAFCKNRIISRIIAEQLNANSYDLIWVNMERMAQYVVNYSKIKKIIDLQDAVAERHRLFYLMDKNILTKLLNYYEYRSLKRYINETCPSFEAVVVSSYEEKNKLKIDKYNRIYVAINAVNDAGIIKRDGRSKDIDMLFVGNMNYQPNKDAMEYCINEILPIVIEKHKEVKLWIIGFNGKKVLRRYISHKNVHITDWVENVNEYYVRAKVFVAPLRIGAGVKLKILEAMNLGLPVVTTSIGCEGMPDLNENIINVHDDPPKYALKVIDLLENPEMATKMGDYAKRYVNKYFSLNQLTEQIDLIINRS
jgi:glycosyltransferase involved in cell wall biosynthesis